MTGLPQKWLLAAAQSASNSVAPKFDGSANKNGHYLLVSKSENGLVSRAEAALNYPTPSQYLKSAFKSCVMTFDYFMNTSSTYRIDVRVGADSANWNTIYRIASPPTSAWRKGYAHIGTRFSPFMADLYGHIDDSRDGAIAVDNVAFVNCSMPKPLDAKAKACPRAGQFLCPQKRFCIDQDDVCDLTNDCGPDGSDEANCANYPNRCSFEDSLYTCGITTDNLIGHESQSNVEWAIRTGRFYPDSYFPKIDNTE